MKTGSYTALHDRLYPQVASVAGCAERLVLRVEHGIEVAGRHLAGLPRDGFVDSEIRSGE